MYNVALIPILVSTAGHTFQGSDSMQQNSMELHAYTHACMHAENTQMISDSTACVQVAGAAAYAATGQWNSLLTGQLVLGSFCIIAWLNTR